MRGQNMSLFIPDPFSRIEGTTMKKILVAMFIAAFEAIACVAQTTNSETVITNWGTAVCNVQMSVSMTNTEIQSGSAGELECYIKNSSTNFVSIQSTGQPAYDFTVLMLNDSGKLHHLGPSENGLPRAIYMNTLIGINPKETSHYAIPTQFDSAIPTGIYQIKVSVGILVLNQWHTLSSNFVHMQIKRRGQP